MPEETAVTTTIDNATLHQTFQATLTGLRGFVQGGSSTGFDEFGCPVTSVGTLSIGTIASTNVQTRALRKASNSATADNSVASFHNSAANSAQHFRQDGFWITYIFGFETWVVTNRKCFFGLEGSAVSTTSCIAGTTQPTDLVNCVGIGMDSGDTELYVLHNDATGTCTKVSTGYVADTSELYLANFVCYAAGDIDYTFRAMGAGTQVTGTLTSNLPTASTVLRISMDASNGAGASLARVKTCLVGCWFNCNSENLGFSMG